MVLNALHHLDLESSYEDLSASSEPSCSVPQAIRVGEVPDIEQGMLRRTRAMSTSIRMATRDANLHCIRLTLIFVSGFVDYNSIEQPTPREKFHACAVSV